MLRPSLEHFKRLAREGNCIPVVRQVLADFDTPLSFFHRLDDGETSFLLESVEGGERWGRYSFIGTGARQRFQARGSQVTWQRGRETETRTVAGDPLEELRAELARVRVAAPEGLGLPPFAGGAVGMIGYDWVRFVERIPDANPDALELPDVAFVFPETVVAYDNQRHTADVIHSVHLQPGDDPEAAYRSAERAIAAIVERLRAPGPPRPRRSPVRAPMDVKRRMTREAYQEAVKRAREYIEAGDIFQVVLSQQFELPLQVEPFEIYRQLRRINPSPYLFFLRAGDAVLVGSSPEILVRLQGERLDVRPIAGTRPRGRTPEEDRALEVELLADPKERAEHLMLVELGRNDAGR
ncbi:MAG: chorismate-binding protein, partial [Proteobacteria bacterium]|nr:chorismate-binding protein [Pseudomonadota bacterium]